jgi:CRISPR type III-A-associated RAMP protein Csm4
MQPAVLIRLRPRGPWRYGPGDGAQDNTDVLFRSDRLFSAVTLAMRQLGWLDGWLEGTARAAKPAVVFTSLFPYQNETLFAPPPAIAWPPPASLVRTPSPVFLSKIRWNAARFVPLTLLESILSGQAILGEQWILDPESGCLLRRDRPSVSPFRVVVRGGAAVDRVTHSAVRVHSSACTEFEADSGLWCAVRYSDSEAEASWADRVRACFRLLADSGFGARRTSGWGQAEAPAFQEGTWPNLLIPKLARLLGNGIQNGSSGESRLYWLLSLFSPASNDAVEWDSGDYRLIRRRGRVESAAAWGAQKKAVQMIVEGSVLVTRDEPIGTAVDVSADGFAHPVYRSGFAIAVPLPAPGAPDVGTVEIPSDKEAPEPRPCDEAAVATLDEESARTAETPAVSTEPESTPRDELPQTPMQGPDSRDEL